MATRSFRQSVPRPSTFALGSVPPWAGRRLGRITLERLRELPDETLEAGVAFGSAVLVPVFEEAGEATILLTRRSIGLAAHPGLMSFPGGRIEKNETPRAAALREAKEEIGLDPGIVDIVGVLRPVRSPRLAELPVAAFLGLLSSRPEVVASADEVEAVLETPLSALLVEGAGWEERWSVNGAERSIYFFAPAGLGDDLVWGMTAAILWDLCSRLVGS